LKKTSMVGPWECCQQVRQLPPPRSKKTSMAAPWGLLPAGLVVATTEVGVDVGADFLNVRLP
jgi:hypothetical protein